MKAERLRIRNETFLPRRPAPTISRRYCKIEEFQCKMALTLCDHSELKQVNDNQQPRDAMTTLQTAVFDTKPYDRESLQRAGSNGEIE